MKRLGAFGARLRAALKKRRARASQHAPVRGQGARGPTGGPAAANRRARGGGQCQAVPHGRPASANPPRPRHGPLDRRDRRAAMITAIAVTVDIVARRGAAGMSERPAQHVRQRCRFVDDEP